MATYHRHGGREIGVFLAQPPIRTHRIYEVPRAAPRSPAVVIVVAQRSRLSYATSGIPIMPRTNAAISKERRPWRVLGGGPAAAQAAGVAARRPLHVLAAGPGGPHGGPGARPRGGLAAAQAAAQASLRDHLSSVARPSGTASAVSERSRGRSRGRIAAVVARRRHRSV